MSSPEEPFEGQNAQFRDPQPGGPTGAIPPHLTGGSGSAYGQQPTPPYGQQPYGQQPYGQQGSSGELSPYGSPTSSQPDPYGSSSPYGGTPSPYGGSDPYGTPAPYGQSSYGQSPGGGGQYGYGTPAPWNAPMGPPPPNHLVYAILTTVLCCLPLGIASIVFAAQVNSKWASGDVWGAQNASKRARQFAFWSAISAFLVVGFYMVVGIVSGFETY